MNEIIFQFEQMQLKTSFSGDVDQIFIYNWGFTKDDNGKHL